MTIAQRLSLLWRRFSPLEERLFAVVRGVLPARAVPIFDAQVRAITHVQRLPGWTEIDYYRRRYGRVDWASVPAFPRTEEFPLARVRFTVERRGYRATLTCVAGHIFDFGIAPGPRDVAFADWDSMPSADLLSDPFGAEAPAARHEIPEAWRGLLRTAGPLAAAMGWVLHEVEPARRITLDEGEFLVLAERDGDEFILHRIEPPSTVMFRLVSHDGTPEAIRGDVADVLRRARRHG